MIKKCEICNIEFETTNPNKKYCSPRCGKQGAKIRAAKRRGNDIIKDCPICGERFEIGKNGALTKYCSQGCADEARRVRNRERWREANPGWDDGTNKVCEWCGQAYTVPARNAHIARFCSDECRNRSKGHKPMEEYLEELEQQKEETKRLKEEERLSRMLVKKCVVCGEEFEVLNHNIKTCNSECSRKWANRLSSDRKRLNKNNIVDRDITLTTLYRRDKGVCYICGGHTDKNDIERYPTHVVAGPKYPSIDHVIPLSKGGLHSWGNIRLACRECNSIKSDIVTDEMLDMLPDKERAYIYAREVKPNNKVVEQYTVKGKLVATYESTAQAERETGIKQKGIQKCARRECKTYKGFVWVYTQVV